MGATPAVVACAKKKIVKNNRPISKLRNCGRTRNRKGKGKEKRKDEKREKKRKEKEQQTTTNTRSGRRTSPPEGTKVWLFAGTISPMIRPVDEIPSALSGRETALGCAEKSNTCICTGESW